MSRLDWTIVGLCAVWVVSLIWVDLNASPAFVSALGRTVSGTDAAEWAQVGVGLFGVAITGAAILFSVQAGYLHQDRARRVGEAEAFTAAYLLARVTGAAVIHGDGTVRRQRRPAKRSRKGSDVDALPRAST